MLKKEKSKRHLVVSYLLVILGIMIPISKYLYKNNLNKIEEKQVEKFFDTSLKEQNIIVDDIIVENNNQINNNIEKDKPLNYIAVLDIPSISLKRGLVSIDDKKNNINYNIQILDGSDMPDIENGMLVLASHSGTGRIAFFNNINKLQVNEKIHIYYKNVKYTYKVTKIELQDKDGNIEIKKNNIATLVLTTCNQNPKGYQLVIISELESLEKY